MTGKILMLLKVFAILDKGRAKKSLLMITSQKKYQISNQTKRARFMLFINPKTRKRYTKVYSDTKLRYHSYGTVYKQQN